MKVNIFEAHDRLLHFKKDQEINIFLGAEECIKKNPLSLAIQEKSPYVYIFAHARTDDDGVTKRMIWDPRLSIPKPQTNSYLFRATSNSDIVQVIWLLPPREMWGQYKEGNVTEGNEVSWSINQFINNRKELEKPHPDDMPEERAKLILKSIVDEKLQEVRIKNSNKNLMDNLYLDLHTNE